MERGNGMPSVTTLVKIADRLEVTVDYLFGAGDAVKEASPPMPEPAPVETPPEIAYIVSQARDDAEMTRVLIGLLKLCTKQR